MEVFSIDEYYPSSQDEYQSAITMGLGTMLSAGRIALMAWGEDKAEAVRAIVEGDMTTACPASVLPSCPPLRPSPPSFAGPALPSCPAPTGHLLPSSFAGLTGESPPLEINKKAPSAVLWLLISPVKCPKTGRTGEGFTFRGTQKCTFV